VDAQDRLVVLQMHGRDAEVGQQVLVGVVKLVGDRDRDRGPEMPGGIGPIAPLHVREPPQQPVEAPYPGRGAGAGRWNERRRVHVGAPRRPDRGEGGGEHRQLSGPLDVRGRDLHRRGQHHAVPEVQRARVPLDARPEQGDVGSQPGRGHLAERGVGERARPDGLPREPRGNRGPVPSPAPLVAVCRGELGGPLQRRARRLLPTAAAGPVGHRLELRGDRLVDVLRGRGPVPRAPVGVRRAGQRLGERAVRLPALGARRGRVHRRPHERVAQLHLPVPDPHEPRPLHRVEHVVVDAEHCGRLAHRRRMSDVVGRCDQQRRLHRPGQPAGPVEEHPLDALGHRQLGRQRRGARELLGGKRLGQLHQRQRIAGGPRDELIGDGDPHRKPGALRQ
jgi:hypothetical protein